MELINEYARRKIDSCGRISIPVHLRNKMRMVEGTEVDVYTFKGEDGRDYVAYRLVTDEDRAEE